MLPFQGRAFLKPVLKNPSISSIIASVKLVFAPPHRKHMLQFIVEQVRNVMLTQLRINPCHFECTCRAGLEPVLSEQYLTYAVPTYTIADAKNTTWQAKMIKQGVRYGLPVLNANGKVSQDFVDQVLKSPHHGVDLKLAARVKKQFFGKDFTWDHAPFSFLIQKRKEMWVKGMSAMSDKDYLVAFKSIPLVCEMKFSYFIGECSTWLAMPLVIARSDPSSIAVVAVMVCSLLSLILHSPIFQTVIMLFFWNLQAETLMCCILQITSSTQVDQMHLVEIEIAAMDPVAITIPKPRTAKSGRLYFPMSVRDAMCPTCETVVLLG